MRPNQIQPSNIDQLNDALLRAACRGTVELCEKLLRAGADVDCEDSEGTTPLNLATLRNYVDLVNLLIEHGCDLDHTSDQGRTALHVAVWNRRTTLTRLLLRHDCFTDPRDSFGDTPLMLAISRGYTRIVKILLNAGCDVHQRGQERDTALHYAARHGRPECAYLLLKAGAAVDIPNIWGITPLLMTTIYGNPSTAMPLLGGGAEVNIADRNNRTALHHACRRNLSDLVFQLLLKGACPDVTDCDGNMPLVDACLYGDPALVTLLVRANCDVSARGQCRLGAMYLNNCSSLEIAVRRGQLDIADILISAGCTLEPLWQCLRRRVVFNKPSNQAQCVEWCHRTLRSPMRLMQISRIVFRRCLRNMPFAEVTRIEAGLPPALSSYLKYDDILRNCQRTSTQTIVRFSQLHILSRF